MAAVDKFFYGTGRRKTSSARVFLRPGKGNITINKKPAKEYMSTASSKVMILQPLELTKTTTQFDAYITVTGGGELGQAGAIRHGLSRALTSYSGEFRDPLKKAGFLSRDPRMVERKKYGRPGARKRFQYSKR